MKWNKAYSLMKSGKVIEREHNGRKVYMDLTGWPGETRHIRIWTNWPSWPDAITEEDLDAENWKESHDHEEDLVQAVCRRN